MNKTNLQRPLISLHWLVPVATLYVSVVHPAYAASDVVSDVISKATLDVTSAVAARAADVHSEHIAAPVVFETVDETADQTTESATKSVDGTTQKGPASRDTSAGTEPMRPIPPKNISKTSVSSETLPESPEASEISSEAAVVAPQTAIDKLEVLTQTEQKIDPDAILPEYHAVEKATDETQDDSSANKKQDAEKKPSFFKSLYNKYFGDEIGEVEKILVFTNILDEDDLVENVQQALSQITVEEFEDFRSVIPRMRGMAKDAAHAVGYYNASFVFKRVNEKLLSVAITPGNGVVIAQSNVVIKGEGKTDAALTALLDDHALQQGVVFNSGKYDTLKTRLMLLAKERGYFDSRWIASAVRVQLPSNDARVDLVLDTGKRYCFGEVSFVTKQGTPYEANEQGSKSVRVNKKLLKQLQPFKPNEYFLQDKVNTFSAQLLSTQYFNSVDIKIIKPEKKKQSELQFTQEATARENMARDKTVQVDQSTPKADTTPQQPSSKTQRAPVIHAKPAIRHVVPIHVVLDSSHPNTAEVGFGYGTDTEFRVRGKVSRNLFNRQGHKVSANAEWSKIKQSLEFAYQRPFGDPLDDTLTFFGGYQREVRDSGRDSKGITIDEATAGMQRNILKNKWNHTVSLTYYNDQLKTNLSDSIIIPPARFNQSPNQQALLLGYALVNRHLWGGVNPYQGYRQNYKIEVGSKSALSDASFIKLLVNLNGLYSFGDFKQHQVLASINAATIVTDDFENVPYNQRYFAGGDRSIRGYDYKSLSPSELGFLIGGQHALTSSLEYSYAFTDTWRAAVFADVGSAYDKKFTNETKVGTGVGVRWMSPVGPLRIDLAAGAKESSIPLRVHFFVGMPF